MNRMQQVQNHKSCKKTTMSQPMEASLKVDQFRRSDWLVSCWVSCALAFSRRQTSCSSAAMYLPMEGSTPRRLFRADVCSSLSTFIRFCHALPIILRMSVSHWGVLVCRPAYGDVLKPRRHLWQDGGHTEVDANSQKLSWPASHNSCQERWGEEFNARKQVVKMAPVVRPTPIKINAVSAWWWVNGRSSMNRRLAIERILLLTFCT